MVRLLDSQSDLIQLGRYELIAELASGGMATVFLARRSAAFGFQRLFAIKRLHPHLARDADVVAMFLDEARVAAKIHHPNVVPIVDVDTSTEGYYLVMDYVEGDTVGRIASRSSLFGMRMPIGVSVRIILDALAGLHAAHELTDNDGRSLGIVHRDVSPQNVLVGIDGIARLSDFGVARVASRVPMTRTGQAKGKVSYMAPEQALGSKRAVVDRRADVFAMGIVLWEIVAAKRLFKGEGDAETLQLVLHEPIARLRDVLPTVPPSLEAVCARALERDVGDRYATAHAFLEALESAAKAGGFLASHKDVADHVDAVLGDDVATRREAIRKWVALKEAGHDDPSSVGKIATSSEHTRFDSRRPMPPSSRPSPPSAPPPSTNAAQVRPRLTAATTVRSRRRRRRLAGYGVLAAAAVVAAVVVVLARRFAILPFSKSEEPPIVVATRAAASAGVTAPAAVVAPPPSETAERRAVDRAPPAAARSAAPSAPPAPRPRPPRAAPAAPSGAPRPLVSVPIPDDIANNPYR